MAVRVRRVAVSCEVYPVGVACRDSCATVRVPCVCVRGSRGPAALSVERVDTRAINTHDLHRKDYIDRLLVTL